MGKKTVWTFSVLFNHSGGDDHLLYSTDKIRKLAFEHMLTQSKDDMAYISYTEMWD
jgi:hypothetical protein